MVKIDDMIVVLSGRLATGKSRVATTLVARFGGTAYSTRELLVERVGSHDRGRLQEAGRTIDEETGGAWVAESLRELLMPGLAVLDSVRIPEQLHHLRGLFGRRVVHVHLQAAEAVLRERFEARRATGAGVREDLSYEEAAYDPTERRVEELGPVADRVVDVERCSVDDVVAQVIAAVRPPQTGGEPLVDVLVGGQYGSEGKGNIASFLAPDYGLLVRVGGPNAGHKVYLPNNTIYAHHQLPSGTRFSAAKVLLGAGSVLRPAGVLKEIEECSAEDRVHIDPAAMVIEEDDLEREGGLAQTIGSTRQGVGAATARRVLRTAADPPVRLAKDVVELQPFLRDGLDVLDDAYRSGTRIFLEGTQGTKLSLYHGQYPHVTSRDTTVAGCLAESGIPPGLVRRTIMVCRSYPIRVQSPEGGHSGPMGEELSWATVEQRAGFEPGTLAPLEVTTTTGRQRRVAEFGWADLRRSSLLNAPTDIALTFADYVDRRNENARRFEQLTEETIRFVENIERVGSAPVSLISVRFGHPQLSIIDRRTW